MSNPEKKTDEKKNETAGDKAGAKAAPAIEMPRGIPVAILRFKDPLQMPGRQVDDAMKAETLGNGRRWEIEFIPQLRHHKVTFFDERNKRTEVEFVHESHVRSWGPA